MNIITKFCIVLCMVDVYSNFINCVSVFDPVYDFDNVKSKILRAGHTKVRIMSAFAFRCLKWCGVVLSNSVPSCIRPVSEISYLICFET